MSAEGPIPLVDLGAQLAAIRSECEAAIRGVLDSTAFSQGPFVERFEQEFAAHVGAAHCVAVQSGTGALHLALRALGVGPGDEVITAPSSFIASATAISHCGAVPVFADVEPDTLNLDPRKVEARLGSRTKGILPVHLFGQTAEMAPILEIAKRRDVPVLEDACQAHGASYRGARAGSLGRAAAFSFYPGKNLGAFGEGGCVTTSDAALAEKVRLLRNHGSPERYRHEIVGYNHRLDGIQGAVLLVKLRHLDRWNARRRELAARYSERLAGVGDLVLPVEREPGRHVWHLYTIQSARRERIFEEFAKREIARAIHYPTPIHLQPAYRGLGHARGAFPVAEAAAARILSLPLYPELTERQQDRVVEGVRAAFG